MNLKCFFDCVLQLQLDDLIPLDLSCLYSHFDRTFQTKEALFLDVRGYFKDYNILEYRTYAALIQKSILQTYFREQLTEKLVSLNDETVCSKKIIFAQLPTFSANDWSENGS